MLIVFLSANFGRLVDCLNDCWKYTINVDVILQLRLLRIIIVKKMYTISSCYNIIRTFAADKTHLTYSVFVFLVEVNFSN